MNLRDISKCFYLKKAFNLISETPDIFSPVKGHFTPRVFIAKRIKMYEK